MREKDLTDGLSQTVKTSLRKAVESNNSENIQAFIHFYRGVLRDSIHYRKIKYFKEYISFPSLIYSLISSLKRNNAMYQNLVQPISYILPLHLKEIIMFYIRFEGKATRFFEEKTEINKFYYEAFRSFNDFFYLLTRNEDWELMEISIEYFIKLTEGAFNMDAEERFRLKRLIDNNQNGESDTLIAQLKENEILDDEYKKCKRRILVGLKYWLVFLYKKSLIPLNILLRLTQIIDIAKRGNDNDVDDLLFFRNADLRAYMGWEDWDFMERKEGVYYPPMARDWMTSGFLIDRINSRNAYFNTDEIGQREISDIPFLHDALINDITEITNDFDKWKKILKTETIEEFSTITKSLLESVALSKRSVIGIKEKAIAAAAISPQKIKEFKENIGKAWEKQARLRRIFDYFGNRSNVTGQSILLKQIGQNTFLEKSKILFIDGEYYSHIYGIEQFGSMVGRWEDDLFLDVVLKETPTVVEETTLLKVVSKCIEELRGKNVEPTMIYVEASYVYKDEEFLRSERYSREYDLASNDDDFPFFVIGTFDKIPIFSSFSSRLKDRIVVSDFSNAFVMNYKTDESWYKNELSIIVEEVSDELAQKKYAQDPNKWKTADNDINLSQNDAITLIKTSIIVDIETIVDFSIRDSSHFTVGYISNPIAE
jgi:hypothetical protein